MKVSGRWIRYGERGVQYSISSKENSLYDILTLMGILEDKGVLIHTRSGRAYIYHPLLSREQATKNQIRDVLCRFFDGRRIS